VRIHAGNTNKFNTLFMKTAFSTVSAPPGLIVNSRAIAVVSERMFIDITISRERSTAPNRYQRPE
jgi:hypothetical protein